MGFVVGSSGSGFRVKLYWDAPNVNDLISDGYDLWKIEHQTISWNPIGSQTAWPPLTTDMNEYVYHHSVVDPVLTPYRATPYRSSDQVEGTPIEIIADNAGYCSIQDVRDQGYEAPTWTDEKILAGINKASAFIDKFCRQWFDPRFHYVILDGKDKDSIALKIPIIAMMKVLIDGSQETLDNYFIYNRHLTHGIVNPDDRACPKLAYGEGGESVAVRRLHGGALFSSRRKSIKLVGVFGYTDLGNGYVGETVEGNQIPLTYGATPPPIVTACIRLAIRYMLPIEDGDEMAIGTRIQSERTRDQTYTLSNASVQDGSYGITGDIQVDKILMAYVAPLDVSAV